MRKEKQLLLDAIKEKIHEPKAFVLTRYKNLTSNVSADFRKSLREVGGDFSIVKKRILMKAAKENGLALDATLLQGHVGIVFALEDPLSVTKAIYNFIQENEQVLEVLVGKFEGQLCSAKDIKAISELPSQEEMRAQFLSVLEAPMSQTLTVMETLLTSILHCLENKEGTK